MDTIITTMAPVFGAEALKLWGSYAFVFILLVLWVWQAEKRGKERRAEMSAENTELRALNKSLSDRITQLQDQRLEDAKHMIRVTESSTQTSAARAQGDTIFLDGISRSMTAIADRLDTFEERFLKPSNPAAPQRQRGPR